MKIPEIIIFSLGYPIFLSKLVFERKRRVKFRLVRYLCHTDRQIMNAGVAFASVGFSVGLGLVRSVGISVGQAS